MQPLTKNLPSSYRDSIQDHIGENRIAEALNQLQDYVRSLADDLMPTVLLLRRRHSQYRRDKLDGVAASNEIELISDRIMEIMKEAERQATVRPKYAVADPPTSEAPQAAKTALRLVSAQAAPNGTPSQPTVPVPAENGVASASANAAEPAPVGQETIDEQLRQHWSRYREMRPPEQTVAVRCDKVRKRFSGSRFQLDELDFSLKIGQIAGIVGRNASGKTTLLRVILGELFPDSGSVHYPALTRDREDWPHVKRQIGYIRQFPEAWGGEVKTNLHFIAAAHGSTGARNRDLVDWYIQRFGLDEYQESSWGKLSGGFRMRYELVRALVSRPKLLVLDEPLASLDVLARQEFLKNLRSIAYSLDEPVPIIVTSQHLYEIEAIADQMMVLDDGKCLFYGSLAQIKQESTTRLYELNINLPKRATQELLKPIAMSIRETISDGYIVSTSESEVTGEPMKMLVSIFGDRLTGIRDITGSSRRFFVDALNKQEPGGG